MTFNIQILQKVFHSATIIIVTPLWYSLIKAIFRLIDILSYYPYFLQAFILYFYKLQLNSKFVIDTYDNHYDLLENFGKLEFWSGNFVAWNKTEDHLYRPNMPPTISDVQMASKNP